MRTLALKPNNFLQHIFTILKQLATGRVRPLADTEPLPSCEQKKTAQENDERVIVTGGIFIPN